MKNKYIPMLYSTDMVQAIMSDTKLETRRTQGLDRINTNPDKWLCNQMNGLFVFTDVFTYEEILITPKINVGDIIWVRETFQIPNFLHESDENYGYIYKASENGKEWENNSENWKWKPSLFMPKTACRNFLKVVSVHVERLQDIDEQGAINEGIDTCFKKGTKYYKEGDYKNYTWHGDGGNDSFSGYSNVENAKQSFQSLWYKINGKDSWDKNPFVWVYKFERTDKPLDFI